MVQPRPAAGGRREAGGAPDREIPSAPPAGRKQEEATRHNLPTARSSFVGREHEVVEAKRLLGRTDLLTLAGSGGCGKTRLALEVARELVGVYPDGVRLVELAPLSDPALIPPAVAAALELTGSLRSKKTLLVLHNCEHLIDAAARLVDALLPSCPGLRILATSREPLKVAGEVSWPVPALPLPDPHHPPAGGDLETFESVRLFVERARSRLPTFGLDPANAGAVAEICRKLEGARWR